jgi:two-component system sensor histidine kinase UhpB
VQEALTNIVRHSHADNASIDIAFEGPETLRVFVRDDGVGFDVAAMRSRATAGDSIGLLGMQERASLIGGELSIDSAPGKGCCVTMFCTVRKAGIAG